ncbi:hypothetical protein M501DRAFT_1004497 [Patellaria atrata CBS 101060]|uniref:CoA-binding domain-containing protein n=1 Tax=Patellaria atrata CBS 101060 TaxID=1346257 RepID=A0A9P4SBA7_9PEZI|nr:hypothetical protein M501DRAFT_1004497 [Patellaria atrata CBS 101060]
MLSHHFHSSTKPIPFFSILRCHSRANFSTSQKHQVYADTISNLRIGKHTRVLYQGFTGKQATANAKQSIEYGTKIVGGVTPNKTGEHLGLPVLPSVRAAKEQLKPDATAVFVSAQHAAAAIEEAIEAEIPLIVAVAEHIPVHDMLRIHSILNSQSKSRLVGANAPGIISAIGKCRIGFQPLPAFSPGNIGIIAKSGTLSYETVASLTRAGLGQSLCIGMGGDIVAGTDFVDGLSALETDDDTEAIILIGEVGGNTEIHAAEWVNEYKKRTRKPKPIAALLGGYCWQEGKIYGHAGAFESPGDPKLRFKYKSLQDAGVIMVDHPAKFGRVMKILLSHYGGSHHSISTFSSQHRGYHTIGRRPMVRNMERNILQRRNLHLGTDQSSDLLRTYGFGTATSPTKLSELQLLAVTIDRSNRCPCIIVSRTTNPNKIRKRSKSFPYSYMEGPSNQTITEVLEYLQLDSAPRVAKSRTVKLIQTLVTMFKEREALTLETQISVSNDTDDLLISNPKFSFDDSSFRTAKRQQDIHSLRKITTIEVPEVEAEKDGIIYIKLHDPTDSTANIGTLVNGAGLAMNTVDALARRGGKAANFLDTGGKATSETVKKSFELILQDPRVKVVFVNIFGGLTLGDMIAKGVIMAFEELDMRVPVVVRIRGTNEKLGQQIITESGLPLYAFDDFEEAAEKVIELANKDDVAYQNKDGKGIDGATAKALKKSRL